MKRERVVKLGRTTGVFFSIDTYVDTYVYCLCISGVNTCVKLHPHFNLLTLIITPIHLCFYNYITPDPKPLTSPIPPNPAPSPSSISTLLPPHPPPPHALPVMKVTQMLDFFVFIDPNNCNYPILDIIFKQYNY